MIAMQCDEMGLRGLTCPYGVVDGNNNAAKWKICTYNHVYEPSIRRNGKHTLLDILYDEV